jgi:hypothetical protein
MKNTLKLFLTILSFAILYSCDEESNDLTYTVSGNSATYDLGSKDVDGISGNAIFIENVDGSTSINLVLSGTPNGGLHPAHIHFNTAAEGGAIALTLNSVNGSIGSSTTRVTALDDGTAITFSELASFDGYINVHLSADELGTIVAQGDVGQNDLTGTTIEYDLGEKDAPGISGTATFSERVNGEALAELMLTNTPDGGVHPAHIHENTALETGGILFTFTPVDGDTGMSATNVDTYAYSEISSLDAYINVHLSAANLGTIVAQGDIGQNDLTGNTTVYDLGEKDAPGISGTATFSERVNGEALAELMLMNTPAGGVHPAHIHENTAVETGGILFTFSPVDGDTGMSATNVDTYMYSEISGLDAYINVHLSAANLGTIVAQGDIGQNDLTGDSKVYTLNEKDVAGISGTATFYKRVNGSALAILEVQNTVPGAAHPAHIHQNDAATGGAIAVSFAPVNGDTGMSATQIEQLDDETSVTYDEILTFNGYINVHLGAGADLATIVAQGNIGSNE